RTASLARLSATGDGCSPLGEELPRRCVGTIHEIARPAEVVAPHAAGLDTREDDELDVGRRLVGLGEKAVVPGDGERLQEHVDRPAGHLTGTDEVPDVEDVDALGAEGDGAGDRDVVDDTTVDVGLAVDDDRGEDGGQSGRGE